MRSSLNFELRRLLRSKGFLLSLLLGTFLAVYQFIQIYHPISIDSINVYPTSFYQSWLGGEIGTFSSNYIPLLMPFIAALPFSTSLHNDIKTGRISMLYLAVDKKRFIVSKCIVTFFGGALSAMFPFLLSMVLNLPFYPLLRPEAAAFNFLPGSAAPFLYQLWMQHPMLYCLAFIGILSLYAGLLSVFILSLGTLISNSLLLLILPCLAQNLVSIICISLNAPSFTPSLIFYHQQIAATSLEGLLFWYTFLSISSFIILNKKVVHADAI